MARICLTTSLMLGACYIYRISAFGTDEPQHVKSLQAQTREQIYGTLRAIHEIFQVAKVVAVV